MARQHLQPHHGHDVKKKVCQWEGHFCQMIEQAFGHDVISFSNLVSWYSIPSVHCIIHSID